MGGPDQLTTKGRSDKKVSTKRRCTSSTPHDPVTLFITSEAGDLTAGTDRTNPGSSSPRTRLSIRQSSIRPCEMQFRPAAAARATTSQAHTTSSVTKQFSSLSESVARASIPCPCPPFISSPHMPPSYIFGPTHNRVIHHPPPSPSFLHHNLSPPFPSLKIVPSLCTRG